jgi:hypothetical protein
MAHIGIVGMSTIVDLVSLVSWPGRLSVLEIGIVLAAPLKDTLES